jgi:hypothetical protein
MMGPEILYLLALFFPGCDVANSFDSNGEIFYSCQTKNLNSIT